MVLLHIFNSKSCLTRQHCNLKSKDTWEVKMKIRLFLLFSLLVLTITACSGGGGSTTTSSGAATGVALPAQVSAVTATNAN